MPQPDDSAVAPREEGRLGFATRQLHAGTDLDHHRPRATPIHLSAGFVFDDFDEAHERFAHPWDGYSYTRVGNPTNAATERRIADLESGLGALLVGSGQAAVAVTLLALVSEGGHIAAANSIYEGTRELIRGDLGRLGIRSTFVADARDAAEWERAIRPETRLLFAESIPNPLNDVSDVAVLAEIAHRHGIPLVIDNTLATPYLLRPLEHGADIVVHSASKFLAGHGTVLGGVIVDGGAFPWGRHASSFPHLAVDRGPDGRTVVERAGAGAFLAFARHTATRFGPAPSPFNAFFIGQGLETLSLRVARQSQTALALAEWLERQPLVERVDYAGLASSPYHGIAQRYLPDGAGAVLSVTVEGGRDAARTFIDSLSLFTRMTHLGDVRSLVLHPASTTHVGRDAADLAASGIGQGLIRLSIGLEEPADLIDDLQRALAAIEASTLAVVA